MCRGDDKPLNSDEFVIWLRELANELTVPTRPIPKKTYYTILLKDEVLRFDKDEWDLAEPKIGQPQELNWDV